MGKSSVYVVVKIEMSQAVHAKIYLTFKGHPIDVGLSMTSHIIYNTIDSCFLCLENDTIDDRVNSA